MLGVGSLMCCLLLGVCVKQTESLGLCGPQGRVCANQPLGRYSLVEVSLG